MTDLVVVGGGPVGLATAVGGALRGLDVLVIESRTGDGDKACGEGLMPSAVAALAALGVDPAGVPLAGITYLAGKRRAASAFEGRPGRGVRRTELVRTLRARADNLGVPTRHSRVTEVSQHDDGVVVAGVPARYVAVADGLHSPVRRSLGLDGTRRGAPPRYGLRRHYAVEPWTNHVEVHWAADCEAYVTPVGAREVGVAVLCGGGEPYEAWLARFPALRERLHGAAASSDTRGAGPLRQTATARVAGRALLVGDAAGYVDALTGEGLAVGFAAASALVDCVVADRPGDYETAWREVTRRPRLVTEALLRATRIAPVRAALVPVASRLPAVFDAAVRTLA